MVKKIAVLYGGPTLEHEISILTALQAMSAMDPLKYELTPIWITKDGTWYTGEALFDKTFYGHPNFNQLIEIELIPKSGFRKKTGKPFHIDICLIACHGSYGEDGCIQGLLELSNLPYTSCGPLASSLTMNKAKTKESLKAIGINVLPHLLIKKEDAIKDFTSTCERIKHFFPFPLFIKPNQLGSSFAISKVSSSIELEQALAKVFIRDTHALVEPLVSPLLEINISILEPGIASVVEIPVADQEGILTFKEKYLSGGNKNEVSGMASLTRVIDPKDLCIKVKQQVKKEALKAFNALDLRGVVRFDFMLNTKTNHLYLNEINSIPGSFSYYLWEKSTPRLLFPDLIDQLIYYSEKCFEEKMSTNKKAFCDLKVLGFIPKHTDRTSK